MFHVFAGNVYEPYGGIKDLKLSFQESYDYCLGAAEMYLTENSSSWIQIVKADDLSIVYEKKNT